MANIFSRRVIAYVADFFVVSAIMWIVSYLMYLIINPYETYKVYSYFIYVVPFLVFFYFVILEKFKGSTVGKALMYIQVRSKNGAKISWAQAIVRNLTKLFWIPILFDLVLGFIFTREDRLFNSITKTIVVDERKYNL
ncbi:RDD family protein [Methanobrevibacter oralis]|uniref:RDD family protein n=1 Tax=Methanobrevibacter oralis TaxID=66851 RepID=A0A166B8I9_METOA|nr:RDD family protein [Methanobrevibacter oralis]KZX13011.1 RDD family protein [Methanobrevibacter oralis]